MKPEQRNILDILGIKITINDRNERMPKTGVSIGAMFMEDNLISDNCVLDNTIYNETLKLLFFVKAHRINNYYYFTINFYNPETKTLYEFNKEFEMLYLKEFVSDNELHVYNSFNDQVGNNYYFKLDEEDFRVVPQ